MSTTGDFSYTIGVHNWCCCCSLTGVYIQGWILTLGITNKPSPLEVYYCVHGPMTGMM